MERSTPHPSRHPMASPAAAASNKRAEISRPVRSGFWKQGPLAFTLPASRSTTPVSRRFRGTNFPWAAIHQTRTHGRSTQRDTMRQSWCIWKKTHLDDLPTIFYYGKELGMAKEQKEIQDRWNHGY